MGMADAGQALVNSTEAATSAGTASRSMRSNPNRGKYPVGGHGEQIQRGNAALFRQPHRPRHQFGAQPTLLPIVTHCHRPQQRVRIARLHPGHRHDSTTRGGHHELCRIVGEHLGHTGQRQRLVAQ